jgi:regulatory protein
MAPPLSLRARALQWLSQREHSRIELRRKLLRAARRRDAETAAENADTDDPGPEVDALLDWLAANRYLSEARFVESRVHARSARFGNRRIVQELAQHGAELDAGTAEQLKASELARARAVWQRKFGAAPAADAAARAKQMRFLAGRGFSAEVIRRVIRGAEAHGD